MPAEADIVWENPFTIAPLSYRVSGATFTNTLFTPAFKISTTTPGANKIAEYTCITHDDDSPLEIKWERGSDVVLSFDSYVNHISCFMGCYTAKANLTNTEYIGIEYGTQDQIPPFDNTPANGGVAQVRWVAGTDSFELFTAKGDGSPAVTIPMRGVSNIYGTDNIPHGVFVELEVDWPANTVRGYINGVPGASYTGVAFPSEPFSHTGSHTQISGLFVTTGTSAAGAPHAFFTTFSHRIRDVKRWNYNIPFNRG